MKSVKVVISSMTRKRFEIFFVCFPFKTIQKDFIESKMFSLFHDWLRWKLFMECQIQREFYFYCVKSKPRLYVYIEIISVLFSSLQKFLFGLIRFPSVYALWMVECMLWIVNHLNRIFGMHNLNEKSYHFNKHFSFALFAFNSVSFNTHQFLSFWIVWLQWFYWFAISKFLL